MKISTILLLSALPVVAGLQTADAMAAPRRERALTRADLDAAIEAFGKSQSSTLATRDQVNQDLAKLRGDLMQRLQDADKAASDRQKAISDRLDKIEAQAKADADQIQTLRAAEPETQKPWWRSALFVAIVSALISAGVAFGVARQKIAAARPGSLS